MKKASFVSTFIFTISLSFVGFHSEAARAAGEVAKIVNLRGQVEVLSSKGQIRAVKRGDTLHAADTVITGQDGRAKLLFIEGSNEVVVGTATRLLIEHASVDTAKPGTHLFLESGEVRSTVLRKYSGEGGDVFQVKTPNAVAGVRGTVFQVGYTRGQNSTVVATLKGLVSVRSGMSAPALVAPGQFVNTIRGTLQQVRDISSDKNIQRQVQRFEKSIPSDSDTSMKRDGSGAQEAALGASAATAAGVRSPPKVQEAQALSRQYGFPVESTMSFVNTGTVSDGDKDKAVRNLGNDSGIGARGKGGALDLSVKSPSFVQPALEGSAVSVRPIETVKFDPVKFDPVQPIAEVINTKRRLEYVPPPTEAGAGTAVPLPEIK